MSQHVSEKRLNANRLNAQKSTGPRSVAGKKVASMNALKHGAFAKSLLLPGEDEELFDHLRMSFIRRFNPRDVLELHLVERIIADAWRIERIRGIEHRMLQQTSKQNPNSTPDPIFAAWKVYLKIPDYKWLSTLEQRLENSMHKAIAELRKLQKEEPRERSELCAELNQANEAKEVCKYSSEEELATDGARMGTDGRQVEKVESEEPRDLNSTKELVSHSP